MKDACRTDVQPFDNWLDRAYGERRNMEGELRKRRDLLESLVRRKTAEPGELLFGEPPGSKRLQIHGLRTVPSLPPPAYRPGNTRP